MLNKCALWSFLVKTLPYKILFKADLDLLNPGLFEATLCSLLSFSSLPFPWAQLQARVFMHMHDTNKGVTDHLLCTTTSKLHREALNKF